MEFWIKRFARISSLFVFFLIFFIGIDFSDMLDFNTALLSLLRAGAGAALFWMAGFIIGDILLKGAVNDIQEDAIDELEGGILQHLKEKKKSEHLFQVENEEDTDKEKSDKKKAANKS